MKIEDPLKNVEYREAFSIYDKDNDGRITTQELANLLRALGRNPNEAELKEIIGAVGVEDKKMILFDEFLLIMQKVPPMDVEVAEKELLEAFRVFDREGKGQIPTAELRHIVTSLGDKLTELEADEMMSEADPSNCGSVDYVKFIKTMLSL